MDKSNLLMVDDSPYMHKMVRAYLEPDPVVLHSAFNGTSGLAEAAQIKPSLILMDIDMPEMDGLEVCRRLKTSPAAFNIPIIFLTADCSINDKVKALDMGAVDYITKPFKPEELRARVRSALRNRQRSEKTEMVDGPSGLWNQTYLNLQIPIFLSMSRRTNLPLSCIVAELDDLAKLRRKHGSEFEDRFVKAVADVFLAQTRTEDLIARCADGRFAALIPATSRPGAAVLADRVRCEIEKQFFSFDRGGINVTCSFGVSDTLLGGPISLLDSADAALALSQKNGGNAVSIAPATTIPN